MAKSVSDKTVSSKAPAASGKAPAKESAGGLKNPFSRSSSGASSKQTAGPRGTVATKPHGRVRTFLREVRIEMSKVTWPPRKELITSTGVVIVAVIIAAVYIGVFDFIWNFVVQSVGLG
jgi:preprotein translocase subunit SecE